MYSLEHAVKSNIESPLGKYHVILKIILLTQKKIEKEKQEDQVVHIENKYQDDRLQTNYVNNYSRYACALWKGRDFQIGLKSETQMYVVFKIYTLSIMSR